MKRNSLAIKLYMQKFDWFVLLWLLFLVLLQYRTHVLVPASKIILSMFCAVLYVSKSYLSNKKSMPEFQGIVVYVGILTAVMIVISSLIGRKTYFNTNLREILYPCALFLYTSILLRDIEGVDRFFKKILPFLNVYFVINAYITYLQLNGHDYLLDTTFYSDLSFDYISGLFGGNDGTHRMTLFASLVTVLTLYYIKTYNKKMRAFVLSLYLIGIISTSYLSTQNDNISYFVFVPLTFIVYYFILSQRFRVLLKKICKPMICIIILYIILNVLITNDTSGFGKIMYRLNMTVLSYGSSGFSLASATDERARLFILAVSRGGVLGQGIGSIRMLADATLNSHFGMASVQSLLYMMGIIPYLLYLSFIIGNYIVNHKGKMISFCAYFVYIFLSAYYTQVLTVFNSAILFSFILMFMGRVGDRSSEREVVL